MKQTIYVLAGIFAILSLGWLGCSTDDQASGEGEAKNGPLPVITIMTHDSFSISQPVLAEFENQVQAKIVILKSGDAGEALNKAILPKTTPWRISFTGWIIPFSAGR